MPNRVAELRELSLPTGGRVRLGDPSPASGSLSGGKVKSTSKGQKSVKRFSPYVRAPPGS